MVNSQTPPKNLIDINKDNIVASTHEWSPHNEKRQLTDSGDHEGQPYGIESPLLLEQQTARHRASSRERIYVVLGYVVLTQLFLAATMALFSKHGGKSTSSPDSKEWRYVIPPSLNIDHCIEGNKWTPIKDDFLAPQVVFNTSMQDGSKGPLYGPNLLQHGVETSFNLPVSSDTLFFTSRGQNWNGAVRIKTSPHQAKDLATVHIALRYNHEQTINRIKACLMERRIDENGVGLFAPFFNPGRVPPREKMASTFQITITLPEGKESSPLRIRNFFTNSPDTKHEIDALSHILFDSFSLKGSNGRVHVESLAAIQCDIRTNNGPITGTFSTTTKLSLATAMNTINVNANLQSKNGFISQFQAKTRNGHLSANIHLTSGSPSGDGGIFDVTASNENGLLNIGFPESPVDSILNLAASTTNDRAIVHLHPAYEGTFDVRTLPISDHEVIFHRDREVKDPSGRDRRRMMQCKYGLRERGYVVGRVSWELGFGQPMVDLGRVNVTTTNAPLHLNL